MDNLTKAKAALILDQPFFASLLLGMDIKADTSVKTLETNGDYILFNPEFIKDKSVGQMTFALGHEVLHAALQHVYRREGRDAKKWNHACDYVVNEMLVKEKIGTPIPGALIDSKMVDEAGGTAEGVYKLLPDEGEDDKGNNNFPGAGEAGGTLDDMKDAGKDQAENEQKQAEMKVKVAQAANAAKMCGKLSAGIERLVKEVIRSKTDWKQVLRKFFSERIKQEYTYAKPKRRFLADDIYLPGLNGDAMGTVVIPVDCSGSINDTMLELFSKEIKGIIEDVKPKDVYVIYFDSEVLRTDHFTQDDTFQIHSVGGGGTAFSPVFSHIENLDLDVRACVFLTDLVCYDFGNEPSYPVLWCSTYKETAPFGEVLKLSEN